MAQRDEVYEHFGPILMEALFDQVLEQLNILRVNAGLPEINKNAFLGSSHNHYNHLEPYDWTKYGET